MVSLLNHPKTGAKGLASQVVSHENQIACGHIKLVFDLSYQVGQEPKSGDSVTPFKVGLGRPYMYMYNMQPLQKPAYQPVR